MPGLSDPIGVLVCLDHFERGGIRLVVSECHEAAASERTLVCSKCAAINAPSDAIDLDCGAPVAVFPNYQVIKSVTAFT